MEFIKSIVKKYSREYSRTLKDGKKKKYHTEQVQITIPKEENIFEDNETVLIIPSSEIDELKKTSKKINDLKAKNRTLKESNADLKSTIEENNFTIYKFKSTIANLEDKIDSLQKTIHENDEKCEKLEEKLKKSQAAIKNYENEKNQETDPKNIAQNNLAKEAQELFLIEKDKYIEKLKKERKELKKDKKELKEKLGLLNTYIEDLKYDIKTMNSSQNRELLKLQDDYKELAMKYKEKNKALKDAKELASYHEEVSKKLKDFILRSY